MKEANPTTYSPQPDWEQAARQVKRAAKQQLLTHLIQHPQVAHIQIDYDGYGDSGQIEHITYFDHQNLEMPNPDSRLDLLVTEYGLCLLPEGWENNQGAFGSIHIDVAASKASVEHNERCESFDTCTFED